MAPEPRDVSWSLCTPSSSSSAVAAFARRVVRLSSQSLLDSGRHPVSAYPSTIYLRLAEFSAISSATEARTSRLLPTRRASLASNSIFALIAPFLPPPSPISKALMESSISLLTFSHSAS